MQKEFKENGFIVMPNLIDYNQLLNLQYEMRCVFKSVIGKFPTDQDIYNLYLINRKLYVNTAKMCQQLPSLHRLGTDEKLIKFLGIDFPVINMKPVVLFSSRYLAEHHFYWKAKPHQDWSGMKGSLDSVVAWMPLFDIEEKHGYLEVVIGSHKDGFKDHIITGPTQEIINSEELNFTPVKMKIGDVLLMSSFCIHRSGNNISEDIRWAVNFRYDNLSDPSFIKRGFPQGFEYTRTLTEDKYDKEDFQKVFL